MLKEFAQFMGDLNPFGKKKEVFFLLPSSFVQVKLS
jgi:hypothetical protein